MTLRFGLNSDARQEKLFLKKLLSPFMSNFGSGLILKRVNFKKFFDPLIRKLILIRNLSYYSTVIVLIFVRIKQEELLCKLTVKRCEHMLTKNLTSHYHLYTSIRAQHYSILIC